MGAPYSYNIENVYNSVVNPSMVHYIDNGTAKFYTRYFLQKAMSVFKLAAGIVQLLLSDDL